MSLDGCAPLCSGLRARCTRLVDFPPTSDLWALARSVSLAASSVEPILLASRLPPPSCCASLGMRLFAFPHICSYYCVLCCLWSHFCCTALPSAARLSLPSPLLSLHLIAHRRSTFPNCFITISVSSSSSLLSTSVKGGRGRSD